MAQAVAVCGVSFRCSPRVPALQQLRPGYHRHGPEFLGSSLNQYQIAPVLKPNKNDKNVSPEELAAYARQQGFAVHLGLAGNLKLLKDLLSGGFPVIVETWFVTPDQGGMGHYRLLVGYDDSQGIFKAFDSYYGPKVTLRYAETDRLWQVFNRTYLVVYPKNLGARVRAILGVRKNPSVELRMAREQAEREIQTQPPERFCLVQPGQHLASAGPAPGRRPGL